MDYVWENQRWIRGWAPCVGLRKAPFDGASRPQLAALFKRHGGPPPLEAELAPEESGLPLDDLNGRASTWRWLGPWVLDSTSFGAERVSSDGSGEGGWIYRFDWSRDGLGYSSAMTKRTFVRCRRWVRPREPADVAGRPGPVEEDVAGRRRQVELLLLAVLSVRSGGPEPFSIGFASSYHLTKPPPRGPHKRRDD